MLIAIYVFEQPADITAFLEWQVYRCFSYCENLEISLGFAPAVRHQVILPIV